MKKIKIRTLVLFVIVLCGAAEIWSPEKYKWLMTGAYISLVGYFMGYLGRTKVLGDYLPNTPLNLINFVGWKR